MRQQQIDFKWLEENFLTANEAATYLGISKQALLSLAKRDVLPFTKKEIWFFSTEWTLNFGLKNNKACAKNTVHLKHEFHKQRNGRTTFHMLHFS